VTAITLAVKKQYVQRVVHAAVDGDIYLTLMPRNAVPAQPGQGVTDDNLFPGSLE
jgi:hypothetical protein